MLQVGGCLPGVRHLQVQQFQYEAQLFTKGSVLDTWKHVNNRWRSFFFSFFLALVCRLTYM